MYDMLIIGSGPAGMGAAIYGVRAGLSLAVLDRSPISGGQVLEREEVSGLSDRQEEMEVFLQKLCQGDAFPMELAELGDDYISEKEFIY